MDFGRAVEHVRQSEDALLASYEQDVGDDLRLVDEASTLLLLVLIEVVPLLEDELFVVLPAGRRARHVRLSSLAGETWIAGCERCRAHLLHLAAEAGFQPDIASRPTTTSPSRA